MFRFRLRTFLIAITLFCLILGWRVAAVESVERPIRELEKLGWQVSYESPSYMSSDKTQCTRPYWRKLLLGPHQGGLPVLAVIGSWSDTDSGEPLEEVLRCSAAYLNQLPPIEEIGVHGVRLSNESLTPLGTYKHVRELRCSSPVLDDSSIDQLAKLKQLKLLELSNTKFTTEGIAELQSRLPSCEVVHSFYSH